MFNEKLWNITMFNEKTLEHHHVSWTNINYKWYKWAFLNSYSSYVYFTIVAGGASNESGHWAQGKLVGGDWNSHNGG